MYEDTNPNWARGFLSGVLFTFIVCFGVWHIVEKGCQRINDVYDCEWSQSPFTPVAPSDDS